MTETQSNTSDWKTYALMAKFVVVLLNSYVLYSYISFYVYKITPINLLPLFLITGLTLWYLQKKLVCFNYKDFLIAVLPGIVIAFYPWIQIAGLYLLYGIGSS